MWILCQIVHFSLQQPYLRATCCLLLFLTIYTCGLSQAHTLIHTLMYANMFILLLHIVCRVGLFYMCMLVLLAYQVYYYFKFAVWHEMETQTSFNTFVPVYLLAHCWWILLALPDFSLPLLRCRWYTYVAAWQLPFSELCPSQALPLTSKPSIPYFNQYGQGCHCTLQDNFPLDW